MRPARRGAESAILPTVLIGQNGRGRQEEKVAGEYDECLSALGREQAGST